ncbi:PfhR, partial [Pasteurella multocida subsp. multocida str. Anand1_cattle]
LSVMTCNKPQHFLITCTGKLRYNKRKARAVIQERSRIHQHLLPQVRQNLAKRRSFDGFKTKTISLKTEFNKSLGQHVVHELHYGLK